MKDISRFKKLFGIKTPCDEHFDYYISVLAKTHKFSNIHDIIKLYEEAEEKYENFNDFSHRKSNEIIDYLKTTRAYHKLNEGSVSQVSYNKKPFKAEIGKKHLSIDLVQANWQVFKRNDDLDELPGTYDELLDRYDLPEVLKFSKNYRQFIFGNLNTKRQQKAQATIIQALSLFMNGEMGAKYEVADLKHDELILTDYNQGVFDFVNSRPWKFRITEFLPTIVDDVKVYEYYEPGTDNLIYKDLFMSNGNRLYMNIKKYILNEPIELRDLYFRENGELAMWAGDTNLIKELL